MQGYLGWVQLYKDHLCWSGDGTEDGLGSFYFSGSLRDSDFRLGGFDEDGSFAA